jgi:hypothetical protein
LGPAQNWKGFADRPCTAMPTDILDADKTSSAMRPPDVGIARWFRYLLEARPGELETNLHGGGWPPAVQRPRFVPRAMRLQFRAELPGRRSQHRKAADAG